LRRQRGQWIFGINTPHLGLPDDTIERVDVNSRTAEHDLTAAETQSMLRQRKMPLSCEQAGQTIVLKQLTA
jgi:hypothetical protein